MNFVIAVEFLMLVCQTGSELTPFVPESRLTIIGVQHGSQRSTKPLQALLQNPKETGKTRSELLEIINSKRREINATGMVKLRYDEKLEKEAIKEAKLYLKKSCNLDWKCHPANNCSKSRDPNYEFMFFARGPMVGETEWKSWTTILYEDIARTHANCGGSDGFDRYYSDKPKCQSYAYLFYDKTARIGCSRLTCAEYTKPKDGDETQRLEQYMHMACKVTRYKAITPNKQNYAQLYRKATAKFPICSTCPRQASECEERLCVTGGSQGRFPGILLFIGATALSLTIYACN